MPESYQVTIQSLTEVHALPGMWTPEKLKTLLELADFDDIGQLADAELFDMSLLVLQDLDEQEAGELALEAVFGSTMRPGVRQNLVDDLREDQPWDDIAELAHQKGVFETMIILQQAFPNRYGTPDASCLHIKVVAERDSGIVAMNCEDPLWLTRLLAAGMNERDILLRLYAEEIARKEFPTAEHIIWHSKMLDADGKQQTIEIMSSLRWIGSLSQGQEYRAVI